MKKNKIKIKDLNSFFIDDVLNQVKQRKKLAKEQNQQLKAKNEKKTGGKNYG